MKRKTLRKNKRLESKKKNRGGGKGSRGSHAPKSNGSHASNWSMPGLSVKKSGSSIDASFYEFFKSFCINNFIYSAIYGTYMDILPIIIEDEKKKRTFYLLIFIVSMLTYILEDGCDVIIKGGIAVLFAVSKNDIPYSTNDIDLLIIPKAQLQVEPDIILQNSIDYANYISQKIMFIFEGIDKDDPSFYTLSLLNKSTVENSQEQIIKISMETSHNNSKKYSAVLDININLPKDKRFYLPDVKSTSFGPLFFQTPYLRFVSKKALIFDRMFYLLSYMDKLENIHMDKLENIHMDKLAKFIFKTYPKDTLDDALEKLNLIRQLSNVEKDDVRQKIYELATSRSRTNKKDSDAIYLDSIKKSLRALIMDEEKQRKYTDSEELIFDQFLDSALTTQKKPLTLEQRNKLKHYILL